MKKIGIFAFVLFILLAGSYAVVQSNIGRNFVKRTLTNAMAESDLHIQIDRVEGTLPHKIDLIGVQIEGKGVDATIQKLSLRPVLWRLLKKEIAFNQIRAQNVSISHGAPFDFDGKVRINQKRVSIAGKIADWDFKGRFDLKTYNAMIRAKNDLFLVRGRAAFSPEFELLTSNLEIRSDELIMKTPFEASGKFLAHLRIHEEPGIYKAIISWEVPDLSFESMPLASLKGNGVASYANRNVKGSFTSQPNGSIEFDLSLDPNWILNGTSSLSIENMQTLLIPDLYGKLEAKAVWQSAGDTQEVHFDALGSGVYYKGLFAEEISLYSDLKNPFTSLSGDLDFEAEHLKWNYLNIDSAHLQTSLLKENSPFQLFIEGESKRPFEISTSGVWNTPLAFDIINLHGIILDNPIELLKGLHVTLQKDKFLLKNAEFRVGTGIALIDLEQIQGETKASFELSQVPLDLLSFNPLEVPIEGLFSLSAQLNETKSKISGHLTASAEQTSPVPLNATIEADLKGDELSLKSAMTSHTDSFFDLDLNLPIELSAWPPKAKILEQNKISGRLGFSGNVEEVLDYFDLGSHHITGYLKANLNLAGTCFYPKMQGEIAFQDGFYENYYSGTQLKQIDAKIKADKNLLILHSFTAEDGPSTGTFAANGQMLLSMQDRFPFEIKAHFTHLQFAEIDLVTATANGQVDIEGNIHSATAKGAIQIEKCNLTIPDHLAHTLPDLEVTYRNPIHPTPVLDESYEPYPLFLDLDITAPTDVTIQGRGLTSIWKGDFHLGGTYTSLAAKGTLELIDGEFNFSARTFKLKEGSLSLSGIEHQMPYLNLAGEMETKGVMITARLQGPLDNPQLTLRSSPPLPLGSIMSYLLFGQDISEIGGFEALQIATSLASLAGTGPDVMESTRQTLGVDRLRVVSNPTDGGGETVALQVGKYVAKGVLVSFTQGAEESSTNISVEVEIKGNIVFQIESDQRQEQGKFTLKWRLNY